MENMSLFTSNMGGNDCVDFFFFELNDYLKGSARSVFKFKGTANDA